MRARLDVRIPDGLDVLAPFVEAGVLGPTEVHVARWLVRAALDPLPGDRASADPVHADVVLGAALAAWAAAHGHACVTLAEVPTAVAAQVAVRWDAADPPPPLPWPEPTSWRQHLSAAQRVVREVDEPDDTFVTDPRPLVLHGDRLYLQRHWADECAVASSLRRRAEHVQAHPELAPEVAEQRDLLLPPVVDGHPNLQRDAADAVLSGHLAVVVGGPGTGKTYTVARLLAVLLSQALADDRPLRVALAAPTGKAAARLQESIAAAIAVPAVREALDPRVIEHMAALTPTTIHALLGYRGSSTRFRHDAAQPLPHDVVVIDETSMAAVPLLARVVEAVRPDARLVLVGDPDQLESVDLGAALADVVRAAAPVGAVLHPNVVRLVRAHRFGADSPIAQLADAIREGRTESVAPLLRFGAPDAGSSVRLVETDDPVRPDIAAEVAALVAPALIAARSAAERGDAEGALAALASVRILCAHRAGPFGVAAWNRLGERWMLGDAAGRTWYAGRPLLVTRNDRRLGLANGDTGVVVRDGDRLVGAFLTGAGLRTFDTVQLDSVETAFAVTVHKSQGSEYPTVVLVLPPAGSPLVGRELLYTAVTRARAHLVVVGSDAALQQCVATPAQRMTGLADALTDALT